jgi:hypothetical protein
LQDLAILDIPSSKSSNNLATGQFRPSGSTRT